MRVTMKSLHVLILIIALLLPEATLAKNESPKIQFISLTAGGYLINLENFDDVYNSKMIFVVGANIGIPISSKIGFYLKANYLQKSGTPLIKTYSFQNGNLIIINERREGNAKFSMLFFNFGLQYNFLNSNNFTVGANGGITWSRINETQEYQGGGYEINGKGILGFFAGGMLEKKFQGKPFSVFTEIQYNMSRQDLLGFVGDYGGFNFNLGFRYYFSK